ncbi:hypothetical protein OIU85_021866 [Salix viminalis]|uniref:Uncharacterized protein n=1 Tax=Salix viminalis TaxID=40686 RepID=A0A9Q0UJJ7_SALVM|nr:hypothetical protein OIU85_021866 [Salix viminalis]
MFTTTSDDGDASCHHDPWLISIFFTYRSVVGYQDMRRKTQMPKPSKGTLEKLSRNRTAAFPSIMTGSAQLALTRA